MAILWQFAIASGRAPRYDIALQHAPGAIMPDFRLPLSGNVVQPINPWTWTFDPTITLDLHHSAGPATKQAVLDEVGSTGRQIGRLGEAVRVLLEHVQLDGLTHAESTSLRLLRQQVEAVDWVKARYRR